MNKITVFWIEDNPIIKNEETVNGLKYPKFLHTETFNYFLFQHPKQVYEFLSIVSEAAARGVSSYLAEKCPSALPDMVVFDYKLFDAFSRNNNALQYTNESHHVFLKEKSASHRLKETFNNLFKTKILFLDTEDIKSGRYMGDKFKTEFKAGTIQADDEFGLYCGITMIREFKEYITVGVPATINKVDKTTMSYNSLFYEWINSYDLTGAIERPAKEDEMKDWSKILNFSANLLRKRIVAQLQSNKITLNLTQLLAYAKEIPTEQDKRIFTFQSAYGIRHLPLDGLFIDKGVEMRDEAIKKWVNDSCLPNFKADAYQIAKDASTKLVDAYLAIPVIKNRIRLSELAVKLCNKETLDCKEDKELEKLKIEFGINSTQIVNSVNNGDAESSNLTNKVTEYREVKTSDNETNRLIVLFTDLQVHKVWQNFCKMNENAAFDGQISTLLKSRPTISDLRAALFPVPKNPLVLPYHYHLLADKSKFKSKDAFEVWDTHFGKSKMNRNALFPKTEYPKNLGVGEKQLCKSFALDIGLESKYYPNWLIK